jgi:hypothetical protein
MSFDDRLFAYAYFSGQAQEIVRIYDNHYNNAEKCMELLRTAVDELKHSVLASLEK